MGNFQLFEIRRKDMEIIEEKLSSLTFKLKEVYMNFDKHLNEYFIPYIANTLPKIL